MYTLLSSIKLTLFRFGSIINCGLKSTSERRARNDGKVETRTEVESLKIQMMAVMDGWCKQRGEIGILIDGGPAVPLRWQQPNSGR